MSQEDVLPDVLGPRALARRLGNVEKVALHLGTRLLPLPASLSGRSTP